jgi:hypothetical protein
MKKSTVYLGTPVIIILVLLVSGMVYRVAQGCSAFESQDACDLKNGNRTKNESLLSKNVDWVEVQDTEADRQSVKFWADDKYMISARVLNSSGIAKHYRIKLDIDVEGGRSRRAAFCTTSPAQSQPGYQTINLKVFRKDSGGDSWAGLLDRTSDISLSFSWSLVSIEESSIWCGAH